MLPTDNNILLSFVNTKLRDEYGEVEDFCADFGIGRQELDERLASVGYSYDAARNQYI